MKNFLIKLWEVVKESPWEILAMAAGGIFAIYFLAVVFRYANAMRRKKDMVYLRITLPRDDSEKDREHDVEKDFREKIAIM